MSLYLSTLPSDLFAPLFLYFSCKELLYTLPELDRLRCDPDNWPNACWSAIWKRDISLHLMVPHKPYDRYIEIFKLLSCKTMYYDRTNFLAIRGYDVLLYKELDLYDNCYYYHSILLRSAEHGHVHIVKHMLQLVPKNMQYKSEIIRDAAKGGHLNIIKEYIDEAKTEGNFLSHCRDALIGAERRNHKDVVYFLIDILEKHCNANALSRIYHEILKNILDNDTDIDIIKQFLKLNATVDYEILETAAKMGNVNIFELLLENVTGGNVDYFKLIKHAAKHEHKEIIEFLVPYLE